MNRITAPLKPGDRGPEVANLQDALSLLIDRGKIAPDSKIWDVVPRNLAVERAAQEYGSRATYVLVHLFQTQHGLPASGQVDGKTADALNSVLQELGALEVPTAGQFIVHGRVSYASGFGAPGMVVRAYDQDMRSEQLLGETRTDKNGSYSVSYSSEKFALAEAGTADLRISVCTADGREIASSPIRFNAGADETIDIVLPGTLAGSSEYEYLLAATKRVVQGVSLVDLNENDLDFLAGELAVDRRKILCLRESARQSETAIGGSSSKAERQFCAPGAERLPAPVFYGWFRLGLPLQPEELWQSPAQELITVLQSAMDQNIVPASIGSNLEEIKKVVAEIQQHVGLRTDQLTNLVDVGGQSLADLSKNNSPQLTILQAQFSAQRRATLLGLLKDASSALLSAIGTVDLSTVQPANRSFKNVVLDALNAAQAPPAVTSEAKQRLAELEGSGNLNDPASPELPLESNPLFIRNIEQGRLTKLAGMIGLPQPKLQTILSKGATLTGLRQDVLAGLVKDGTLDANEANQVGVAAATYGLSDGQWNLVGAIGSANIATIDGGKVKTATDLALLERQDWESLLKNANVPPPADSNLQDYSKELMLRAVRAFPVDALLGRLLKAPDALDRKLALLQPVLSKDNQALAKDVGSLDLQNIPADQRNATVSAFSEVQVLANQHPGLGLRQLFATSKTPAEAAQEAAARLDALRRVFSQNPNADLLSLDYTPGSPAVATLNFNGVTADRKQFVLEDLKSYQRVFQISPEAITAKAVLEAGYRSAWSVAGKPYGEFKASTNLDDAEAKFVHSTAELKSDSVAVSVVSIIDWLHTGSTSKQFTVDDNASSFLRQLNGFSDWFGRQDFCNCQDCQSVLSPAAYFVDLMNFVESSVGPYFSAQPAHALNLKTRRPDLWTLPLTCENTNGLVPYLDIINPILETWIAANSTLTVPGDVYATLANIVKSLRQPFHLALQRITLYLKHFGHSRRDIALALGVGEPGLTRASLNLSLAEYGLIKPASPPVSPSVATLSNYFGDLAADVSAGNDLDVQKLLRVTGWKREELSQFLATSFVNPGGAITVHSSKSPGSIQNDLEVIHGLGLAALDRWHRFSRLGNHLPWTIAETDLLLSCLANENLGANLDPTTLQNLASLLNLFNQWTIPVPELCCYWTNIPQTSTDGGPSLFDQLFNQSPLLVSPSPVQAKRWPAPNEKFLHPALNTAPGGVSSPGDNTNDRLSAGLKINDQQLVQLIQSLAGPLGADAQGFALSLPNLSLLYRHARLATLLGLSVPQLFQFSHILGLGTHPGGGASQYFVSNLADLEKLHEMSDWLSSCGYSLDEIGFVLNEPILDPTQFPTSGNLVADILTKLKVSQAFQFADTVFTQLSGIADGKSRKLTDSESRALLQANLGTAIKKTSSELPLYQLADGFDPAQTAITMPAAGPQIKLADVRSLLSQFHPRNLLPVQLGASLDVSVPKAGELLQLAGVDLGNTALAQSMMGGPDATPLDSAIAAVLRFAVLYKKPAFDPQDKLDSTPLTLISAHRSVFYLPATGLPSDLEAVRAAATYASLATPNDPSFATSVPNPDINALHRSLDQGPMTCSDSDLAKALRTDAARISGLRPNLVAVPADPNRLAALARIQSALQLASDLWISGETLKLAVSDDSTDPAAAYKALQRAADGMYAAFRSKYPNDADFQEKVGGYDNTLRVLKRDALTDFLLSLWPHRFPSLNTLSEYFLIDVQLSGCSRTSLVVAAISSVQFYVQRILLNLEASNDGSLQISPTSITSTGEWTWRKNFRVWQANRKVFLFPENYVDPDLRRNKTPLFKKLQDVLLQRQIDDQGVQDAYADYMAGLADVANLKIAGSFHDVTGRTDTLHLFGATPADPPVYYYRAIKNPYFSHFPPDPKLGEVGPPSPLDWSSWQKIDVQIPVRKVAPIIFNGALYVFWVEMTTKSRSDFKDGSSQFMGYQHRMTIKYSSMRLDGTWTAPQAIDLGDRAIIDDPLLDDSEIASLKNMVGSIVYSSFEPFITKGRYKELFKILDQIPNLPAAFLQLVTACFSPRYDSTHPQDAPSETYTLAGFEWDQVYPVSAFDDIGEVQIRVKNFAQELFIDMWSKTPVVPTGTITAAPRAPYGLFSDGNQLFHLDFSTNVTGSYGYSERSRYLSAERLRDSLAYDAGKIASYETDHSAAPVANLPAGQTDIAAVNSSSSARHSLVDVNGDQLLILGSYPGIPGYFLMRTGTTTAPTLSKTLFLGGIDGLLSTDFQTSQQVQENPAPVSILSLIKDESNAGQLALNGPFGIYFREIFFHIPFLIAQHLNSQRQFAAAQRWYQYIFDPTATDPMPSNATPDEQKLIRNRQVWRYVDFRSPQTDSLLDTLTNPDALNVYRKDPFDPHAIASFRMSAYQKAVVLRYIDNLLDWGDSLFAEFTMESVNEATLLYLFAQDILGPRPADIGDCGEDSGIPRDYAHVVQQPDDDFLVEIETVISGRQPGSHIERGDIARARGLTSAAEAFGTKSPRTKIQNPATSASTATLANPSAWNEVGGTYWTQKGSSPWPPSNNSSSGRIGGIGVSLDRDITAVAGPAAPSHNLDYFGLEKFDVLPSSTAPAASGQRSTLMYAPSSVVRQGLMFCIPHNPELLARWDRVEDRLNKIRNCKNITGAAAQLALFSPELDPHMLNQLSAAGLTLTDVLNVTSGNLPPYRFTYIIEKARQFAGTVQSFGSQLLSALEKRDAEQLNQLRTVHEQNLLTMRKTTQEWEVNSASDTLESLRRQQLVTQGRKDYYTALLQNGPIGSEVSQIMNTTLGTELGTVASILRMVGGICYLIPQLGAPTAMKWGGKEMGDCLTTFGQVISEIASVHHGLAAASAQSAIFERRTQDWTQQIQQAQKELDQFDKQISAANFRVLIAQKSLDVHNKSIDQAEEIFRFYQDRFTNAGLYTALSTLLQRLYLQAFNAALAMVNLAEQAYLFERPEDDNPPLLTGSPWDASTAGLFAGESLVLYLQQLEQRFVETNFRKLEIEQSFSLAQFAPDALEQLREQAKCSWSLPEWFFDLYYPGHYNRRLKAVRVTIPCVVGPFTNVAATLALTGSRVRHDPSSRTTTNLTGLLSQPLRHTVSIATSKGQTDAGVFEFNFRDERYMPFEGAGAVSDWNLTLPGILRAFDYRTISDVIIHLSYTADYDDNLKDAIDTEVQGLGLIPLLKKSGSPLKRIFSLRRDFPDVYYRLTSSPVNTEVAFTIEPRHMPFFLGARTLGIATAKLHVISALSSLNGLSLATAQKPPTQGATPNFRTLQAANTGPTGAFGNQDFNLGDVLQAGTSGGILPTLYGTYLIKVANAGPLAPQPTGTGVGALDPQSLSDVLLEVVYGLA